MSEHYYVDASVWDEDIEPVGSDALKSKKFEILIIWREKKA